MITNSQAGKRLGFKGYVVSVFDGYDGGSRREWLKESGFEPILYIPEDEVIFEDYSVAGTNGLIVQTIRPGSMGGTSLYIFKGNKVFVISTTSGQTPEGVKNVAEGLEFL